MTATIIRLADHQRPRPRSTAAHPLGSVVPLVRRETDAVQASSDLMMAQGALDRATARLADAEARGAAQAEAAFLRGLWRTARMEVVLASARLGRAHLRAA